MTVKHFIVAILAFGLMVSGPPAQAKSKKAPKRKPSQSDQANLTDQLIKSRADVVKASIEYKASLERLLGFHEGDVRRAAELLEKRKELYALGGISKRTLEESERALADARAKVDETRNQISKADSLIAEAEAAERLAKSPMPSGAYRATAALIRYNGPAKWSLLDAAHVEDFFAKRFGRSLPVSAFGQTEVHDRMGFDHGSAIDVAVHPDSYEGRKLMEYLRKKGIPFIAFRYGMPGSSTGAHIHIGKPSQRITATTL